MFMFFSRNEGRFTLPRKLENEHNPHRAVPLGFYLYISNTTDITTAVRCYHANYDTIYDLPDVMHILCALSGRYVIYYNERKEGYVYPANYSQYAFADLCEVEVYGCPAPVEDGPGCTRSCPTNCEQCYPYTGVCQKCKHGYQGTECEPAFPQGKSHVRNSDWVCIVDNYNDVRHLGNDAVCH
uniref:Uncharacterized protein n=1 Tax=Magallana gigas TaxID=29159 RepID=K1R5N3_MAGGI